MRSLKLDQHTLPSFYSVLSVAPSATFNEIKVAYHAALLRYHPDKRISQDTTSDEVVDIDHLKQAYVTLSSPDRRALYDAEYARRPHGPRPAQVVSLEDFSEVEALNDTLNLSSEDTTWTYGCRCGGVYTITQQEMEDDRHLVGCGSCSEVVWVGYQAVEDGEDSADAVD